MSRARFLVVPLLLLAVCAGPGPVALTSVWPDHPSDYAETTQRSSRHGSVRINFSTVLDVHVVLLTPEWRAAYVAERVSRSRATAAEEVALREVEQGAAGAYWEVELLAATAQIHLNDFIRGPKSMWRMALIGDDGRAVAPIEVLRDLRPREEIVTWFPDMGDFHEAYVVRFPRVHPDGRALVADGGHRLALTIGGALGSVELVWEGR